MRCINLLDLLHCTCPVTAACNYICFISYFSHIVFYTVILGYILSISDEPDLNKHSFVTVLFFFDADLSLPEQAAKWTRLYASSKRSDCVFIWAIVLNNIPITSQIQMVINIKAYV